MPPTEHDYYAALLARYLRNECTDDEHAQLDRWYASLGKTLPELAPADKAALAERSWGAVVERIQHNPESVAGSMADAPVLPLRRERSRLGRTGWGVAASVAGLLLAGLGWWQLGGIGANPERMTITNRGNSALKISLDDGSVVWLNPNSTIRYPKPLAADQRSVTLDGQAFFVVTKEAERPFMVQTRSLTVRVLGTSFRVRAFDGQATAEVAVRTGRVLVSRPNQKTELVLLPNERVTLGNTQKSEPVKALVVAPDVINPAVVTNRFVFADTPVAEVFTLLERAYNVRIEFDKRTLATCSFTARLTDQPLFTKLDVICASIGATYTVQGTTIVVRGAGCSEP
ncbi:MAG: FecR domain-containing protein [Bacteroidetes bacterium]|nr:FecR domain-containing protein [Fibrella sp.]